MSTEPATEITGAEMRRWGVRQLLRMIGASIAGGAIVGLVLGFLGGGRFGAAIGMGLGYLGVLTSTVATAIKARARPGPPSRVRATRDGLWVGDKQVARRSDIENGVLVPEAVATVPRPFTTSGVVRSPTMLRFKMKGALAPPVEVAVESLDDGRAVLAALELDPAHTVGVAQAMSPWIKWSAAAYVASMLLAGAVLPAATRLGGRAGGAAAALVVFLGFIASIVSILLPMHVVVGTDGVALAWAWWKKFIPMRDIRTVELDPARAGVVLGLASGEKQRIVFRGARSGISHVHARAEAGALKERIEEAMAVDANAIAPGEVTKALARGGSPIAQWLQKLRGAARAEATFRDAAVAPEQLWRAVEDARTDKTVRAAAAVALAAQLDDSGRERLRVAASSTASPKLRFALEAATRDDDAELQRALEELDGEAAAEEGGPAVQ